VTKLSKRFKKKWEERPKGLGKLVRSGKPLRPQIRHALKRVELQDRRMEQHIRSYMDRDKQLFGEIVQGHERNDKSRVKVLANELAEIRRQRAVLMKSRLALDHVALRLRTVYEYGNTISSLAPTVDILGKMRTGISGIMPEVSDELHEVETTLNDIVTDVGQTTDMPFDFNLEGQDAEKIMQEAASVAEARAETKLPALSSDTRRSHIMAEKDYDNR
jgi:division protein CdvB (Snf7/Vps24/ESCRT-III family)